MAPGARAQQPTKLKLGVVSALFDSGSLIALEKGYFREQGLDVEVKIFPGTADANQALSIGAVDVIESGISPTIFNAKLRHIDMSIVASAGANMPGHGTISVVLRKSLVKSGRYKGPADLKGLKLSTGLAAPTQWLPSMLAHDAGVDDKTINFVALGIGNTASAMVNGAIDGGSVNEPFATLLVEKADGVRVASMDQKFPNFPAGYLIYGPTLTKKNVDAGRRYMVAYFKGMRDYRLAFGPQRQGTAGIIAILKKYNIQISPSTPSLGVSEDLAPSFAFVDKYVDWQIAKGNMRVRQDPKTLVDDRFRQYAVQQLKH
ncbi:MAG TPA: ABC transporter substrate-binding protein [Caulobacteraceae bacterium]|nr:ABC transporter substrate-binding protein [Caulobacteraceae bacterium]